MSDLLNSRWAPGASGTARNNPPQSQSLRRPRSEYRIRTPNSPLAYGAEPSSTSYLEPKPTFTSTAPGKSYGSGSILPPSEELARFMKIVARLRWKLPFLAEGYRLATQVVHELGGVAHADVAQAEIMFKIDFHEYYALLERAIVHLLAVFNIAVSSVGGRGGTGGVQVMGGGYHQGAGIHRYHANVLQALEEESTPLSPVLGSGHVLGLLRKAKELRNRWKTADMTKEERERDPFEMGRAILPLTSFNFDEIFLGIFGGLEEAYVRARIHVELCKKPGDPDESVSGELGPESDWVFMVDAMDWEAV
ncbi:uncharacterized protein N7483_004103 [Penicillium malachiteum]|uniref:uncharacterized protein n=1 Tax=Penicillium malachiteum TaxID=1324776 RepID=UPI002548BA14|nr:uncharacterized protein N7483_004103 [Penicillium malachiteum]KAJ5729595.1 hypothetical protein N7483_004103 [Penicillium malachiteum]